MAAVLPGTAPAAPPLYEQDLLRQATGEALRPGGVELTARLLSRCELPAGARLLDAGCGCGASLAWLRAQGNYCAIGVDLSAALLREAANRRLDVAHAPASSLPFPAGCFDAVLMECSLSAILQPELAIDDSGRPALRTILSEIQRVLRPGGWLLLSDLYARQPAGIPALRALPGAGCLRSLLDLAAIQATLEALGFTICFWEDHSKALRQLGNRLYQAYGSRPAFWEGSAGGPVDAFDLALSIGRAKPGYFILLAQRIYL